MRDAAQLAVGNALGSNLANIGLCAGYYSAGSPYSSAKIFTPGRDAGSFTDHSAGWIMPL